jgi:precorrin-3B synthase
MIGRSQTMTKGWCPGALSPMASGDGLIVRLKPTGGIVPLDLAAAIARWSQDWGNGEIDLTSRANLQLRGLSDAGLPGLRDAMADWGLLDVNPEAEAVRNVVASPLAGLDPQSVLDIRPIVATLERRLIRDAGLHVLPAKFGFAVDDGGRFGLAGVAADVMFQARRATGEAVFDIRLDGAADWGLGSVRPGAVADAAAALGQAFVARRASDGTIRRMRDWVAGDGVAAVAESAGFALTKACAFSPAPDVLGTRSISPSMTVAGLGLLFGRINARSLADLTAAARSLGGEDIRLTPWRAILLPLPTTSVERLADLGFIRDPDHPLRRTAACVGAPACISATTNVRGDAVRLAAMLPPGQDLHVSGCAKGCAHPGTAAVTLVAQGGRYGLVRAGTAWDRPVAENLTVDDVAALLTLAEPVA